jgi:hypothetical protein
MALPYSGREQAPSQDRRERKGGALPDLVGPRRRMRTRHIRRRPRLMPWSWTNTPLVTFWNWPEKPELISLSGRIAAFRKADGPLSPEQGLFGSCAGPSARSGSGKHRLAGSFRLAIPPTLTRNAGKFQLCRCQPRSSPLLVWKFVPKTVYIDQG